MEEYAGVFKKENIDVEMLIDLDTDEFMNMTKELGITTWGHRQKLKKAIKLLKESNFGIEETIVSVTDTVPEETFLNGDEQPDIEDFEKEVVESVKDTVL